MVRASGGNGEKPPYECDTLEHYIHELDLICPEYNEPWPEDLLKIEG